MKKNDLITLITGDILDLGTLPSKMGDNETKGL